MADFRAYFLRLMQEAGEKLGKAAAEEITKAKIVIEGGGVTTQKPGEPLSGRSRSRTGVDMDFFFAQFNKIAAPGDPLRQITSLLAPFLAGRALMFAANLPNLAEQQAESMRRYTHISPSMAAAFQRSDAQDLLRDLRQGEQLAPSTKEALDARRQFKDQVSGPLSVKWDQLWNKVSTEFLKDMTTIFGRFVKDFVGEQPKGNGINPWVDRLDRFADTQRAREEERRRVLLDNIKKHARPIASDPPPPHMGGVGGIGLL